MRTVEQDNKRQVPNPQADRNLAPDETQDASGLKTDEPKPLPGDLAIWLFIFMELLVFGIFFIVYAVVRMQHVAEFSQYQRTLNKNDGLINTLLLITASYCVVQAVHAIKRDKPQLCGRFLVGALAGGAGFLVIKSAEFADKIASGIDWNTHLFYLFYFSLTAFHVLHVILGMIILLAVWFKTINGHYDAQHFIGVESGASYWHMVDLVWIILFPLVYLLR